MTHTHTHTYMYIHVHIQTMILYTWEGNDTHVGFYVGECVCDILVDAHLGGFEGIVCREVDS